MRSAQTYQTLWPKLIVGLLLLAPLALAAGDRKVSDRQVREAAAAGKVLNAICQRAGFSERNRPACAAAISEHCKARGVDPRSQRCWEQTVAAQKAGKLNYAAIFPSKRMRQTR